MYSQSMKSDTGTTSKPISPGLVSLFTLSTLWLDSVSAMAGLVLYRSGLTDIEDE